MSLFQKACDTYDAMLPVVPLDDQRKFPLAPISHTVKQAALNIMIDAAGCFQAATMRKLKDEKDKSGKVTAYADPKIVMPVTEASLGRGVGCDNFPHGLCDYLRYLNPVNETAYGAYVSQLSDWVVFAGFPKLEAILDYVRSGTVMDDLAAYLKPEDFEKLDDKTMVCWTVNGLGADSGPCWMDRELMDSFSAYYMDRLRKEGRETGLCMVTGKTTVLASNHAKGVVPFFGNAKLISFNSSKNNDFTYKGRFVNAEQALTVSYEASQKAHNALAWLVGNQAETFGNRVFLCWNPKGIQMPGLTGVLGRGRAGAKSVTPSDYRRDLDQALLGWKSRIPVDEDAVLLILDAPTPGCLSVVYYGEMTCSDYLDRFYEWERTCCAGNLSPALGHFIQYAYGTPRDGKYVVSPEAYRQNLQRMVLCRVEGSVFPSDVLRRLVNNASSLMLCSDKHEKGVSPREKLLRTACAAIRKYKYDTKKEEWDMALDLSCTDRSYLFGRLLAIADKVEGRILYRRKSERETAAMRYQKAFSQRPMQTWKMIHEGLEIYFAQLPAGARTYYRGLIESIMTAMPHDKTMNRPLEDVYLLGFYEQRAELAYKAGDTGPDTDGADMEPEESEDNDKEEE